MRIRHPQAVAHPAIAKLIGRAILAVDYPGTTPQDLYAEWAGLISLDTFGMFVGFEDDGTLADPPHRRPAALAVATLPTSHSMWCPLVYLVYSEGRKSLARKVAARLKAWMLEAGYNRMVGHNLYRDDDVYIRAFRHVGPGRALGSLIEFTF